MRFPAALALIAACGGHPTSSHGPAPLAYTADFSALRWAPEKPTYIVAARTVGEAQRAAIDMIESFGLPFGATAAEASAELERMLSIDPLSADVAGKLGVDLAGGLAVFSEDVNPTFVIHLTAPDVTHAFFEHLRELGLQTRSLIVEGTEINTSKLAAGVDVSWAVEHDWLWVHFSIKLHPEDATAWFVHAHHAEHPAWTENFGWAKQAAERLASKLPALVGFIDSHSILANFIGRAPREALACARLFQPIGRVAVAIEGNGHHTGGRLAIDLGSAAPGIAAHLMVPPPGFDGLSAAAPLAAQWNLDVGAILAWFQPCADAVGIDVAAVTGFGIRTSRAAVLSLDPDHDTGTGVLALDLSSSQFLARQLDEIPHRSLLESDRSYGAHRGHRLSIPFVLTLDYVLDDHTGMLAIGDGLLDKLVMGAPAAAAPIFALDVRPPAMSASAWEWLLRHLHGKRQGQLIADQLMHWRDGHIAVSLEHDSLVIEASGNRR